MVRWEVALKRCFDILVSAFGLIASLPLSALIAVAIKLDDGGPVFYHQPRVGKDRREFISVKFRSMRHDSDTKWGAVPATANDPRVTRVGAFLRATGMDELPQLWNILRGEMSFVGPRPEWTELVKKFRLEIRSFDQRHCVTPGLTGIAQIYGHSETPRRQKLRYELLYVRRRSFWLDVRLILVSFLVSFAGGWERRDSMLKRAMEQRPRVVPQLHIESAIAVQMQHPTSEQ